MTEIQADPRRCHCGVLMKAVWQSTGKAFTVYKCDACGREVVVDSFNLEVK